MTDDIYIRVSVNLNEKIPVKIRYFTVRMENDEYIEVCCKDYGLGDCIRRLNLNCLSVIGMKGVIWFKKEEKENEFIENAIKDIVDFIKTKLETREQKLMDSLSKTEDELENVDDFMNKKCYTINPKYY